MLTDALVKYAVFSGRARRTEYWGFALMQILLYLAATVLDVILGVMTDGEFMIFTIMTMIALFIPSLAVTVRRLHDTDKSGWWLLIYLVPFIGGLVILAFMLIDSDPGTNRFGPNPKNPHEASEPATVAVPVPEPSRSAVPSGWVLSGFDARGNRVRFSMELNNERFRQDGVIIGRDAGSADLAITSDSISRRHARIFYSDGDLWVEDLNSTNGTLLNGNRLQDGRAGVFTNGATLAVGDIELMLTRVE